MARRGDSSAVEIDDNRKQKNVIYVTQVFGGLKPLDRWFCLNGDVTTAGGVWRRYPGIKHKAREIERFQVLPHLGFFDSLLMDGSIYLIGHSGWRVTPSPNEKLTYTQLPPMLRQGRYSPHGTFRVDGKIYVFGGSERHSPVLEPYGEVYDSESNQWVALPDTPHEYRRKMWFHAVVPHPNAAGGSKKKIVLVKFCFLKGLYAFDPEDKVQPLSCFDRKFHDEWWGPVAVWKHFLFYLTGHELCAYNYLRRKLVGGDVWAPCGKFTPPSGVGYTTLVDMGEGCVFHLRFLRSESDRECWLFECSQLDFKISENGGVVVELGEPVTYSASGCMGVPLIHGNHP